MSQVDPKSVPSLSQVCPKFMSINTAVAVLNAASGETTLQAVMELIGKTNKSRTRNEIIKPLIKYNLIKMTIPDKPSSSKQKYIATQKGINTLKGIKLNKSS